MIDPKLLIKIVSNLKRNFPKKLINTLENPNKGWYIHEAWYTPNIQLVIDQILNCPYKGGLKQIYLESKAIELIALRLALLFKETKKSYHVIPLWQSNVENLQNIKSLLRKNIVNPPGLVELCHKTGINITKIKAGFKTLFGVSVGEYIRDTRMEQVRHLLESGDFNVSEACYAVGYRNLSHFIHVFKMRYRSYPGTYIKMKNHIRR